MRPLFSPSWYRVKDLHPRLRTHAEIHRQVFRDEVWYVVEDQTGGGFQRISEAAYQLVGLMNGERSVDAIWRHAAEALGDRVPPQDEVIELLVRLHQADILHAQIPADMARVTERGAKSRRKKTMQSVKNPLAIRVPLVDPDRFLRATLWIVRPLIGPLGLLLWLGVVGAGVTLATLHWEALTQNVADRAFTAENLLLALAVYPFIKAFHELGHAYATRRWGGEVHEIGVMLLVFMPVPYVDASASSAFRSKWRRAAVAAAGIWVELFLAGLAMIAWAALEPGLLRAATMNVMVVAGISTLLFNGNPLLKFDGYYVLADLAEIPNLGTRANQHLLYLIQRWLFGMEEVQSPALARGERAWFVVYGIAALVYRMAIMATIILFVAGQFFEVGLALAFWTLVLLLVVPAGKALHFVLASSRLDGRRRRAVVATATVAAAVLWALFAQPLPYATMVEGVVWAPEETVANAGADGFVAEVLANPGTAIASGTPILRIEDPLLDARVDLLEARVRELELRRLAALSDDRAQLDMVSQELALVREELALAVELRGDRILTSGGSGTLLLAGAEDLVGRFVRRGETLAHVLGPHDAVIRAVVSQRDIDLVRRRLQGVSVRLASDPAAAHPARVLAASPAATDRLPSLALATTGGGRVTLDPSSPEARSLESLFLFDLVVPAVPLTNVGERVFVRFDHGAAPIGAQLWRSLRQLFLRDLNV